MDHHHDHYVTDKHVQFIINKIYLAPFAEWLHSTHKLNYNYEYDIIDTGSFWQKTPTKNIDEDTTDTFIFKTPLSEL